MARDPLDFKNETIETTQTSARIIRNEADYYADYAELNNFNYDHVFATPILNEIYYLNFMMRKLSLLDIKGWSKFLNIFDIKIWLLILISLVVMIIFGAVDFHFKTRKSWFESIINSFSFYCAKLIANDTGKFKFGNSSLKLIIK